MTSGDAVENEIRYQAEVVRRLRCTGCWPEDDLPPDVACRCSCHAVDGGTIRPTTPRPSLAQMEEWMLCEEGCEATDGCWVEPDGTCPHGHPSWMVHLGLI